MRVLVISWAVSDHRGGGEPIASYELARHLALEGVQVDVVTPDFDVRATLPQGLTAHPVQGGPRPGNTGRNKSAMLKAARALHRQHRYDATHVVSQFTSFPVEWRPFVVSGCWMFPPDMPPASGGSRLLTSLRAGSVAYRADVLRDVAYALAHERARGWNLARTLAEADCVIVRQSLGREPFSRQAKRVEYIPFGIDPDLFPYSDATRDPVVLYAGNLAPYKNVDGLVQAFAHVAAEHPRARLRIAGQGAQRTELETLAHRLGIGDRVAFLGHVPRPDLVEEFRAAAAFVLPSRLESFGQVCLEAMACGTPVVVSDRISGAHDFLREGENGFLVSPGDTTAIASAMSKLLADPARARAMGAQARRTAERFTWREVARRHVELYQSL